MSRPTVQLWRKRVHQGGIEEVWKIAPGRGRKPQGMTHWRCLRMAEAQGVSKNTINRLWQLHTLKPHLSRTFELSRDANFLEKLTDVVGVPHAPSPSGVVEIPAPLGSRVSLEAQAPFGHGQLRNA